MAISDTLSNAAEEIRQYLVAQPSMYADVISDVGRVLGAMDVLRHRLDDQRYDPSGPWASAREAAWSAVEATTPRNE